MRAGEMIHSTQKGCDFMRLLFIISIYGFIFLFITGIIRMILDGMGALIKHDSGTPYRNAKDRALWNHFKIAFILFALAVWALKNI